jgi:hypothetical protein
MVNSTEVVPIDALIMGDNNINTRIPIVIIAYNGISFVFCGPSVDGFVVFVMFVVFVVITPELFLVTVKTVIIFSVVA